MVEECPYGSWSSPVTAELLVQGASRLTDVHVDGGLTWWSETRPGEGGRVQVLRRGLDGSVVELLPEGFSARTRVHEYGGGAWWVHAGVLAFANWTDQRLYRLVPGDDPRPITPEPASPHGLRYADGCSTADGRWIVCVREAHTSDDVVNEIVVVAADGSAPPRVLAGGRDFFAAPRISRDGRQLAWLAWDLPAMPWDGTELWVGHLHDEPEGLVLERARREAGGPGESLVQPEWGRHGALFVVSDRTGWWNVHRVGGLDDLVPVHEVDAEVGQPAWSFGQSRYVVLRDGTVVLTYEKGSRARLVCVSERGTPVEHALPFASISQLRAGDASVTYLGTSTDREPVVAASPLDDLGELDVVRPARSHGLDAATVSRPERVSFPTEGGRTAHAWFYRPASSHHRAPHGERPPLLVMIHGGPTSCARAGFDLSVQFWTSRGFAVVDVDYGGSTGYGRDYRRQLDGAWGIIDVDDCCAAARWLAERGDVDGARLLIRGGSAGGYTVLNALCRHDVFTAGASYYGVADLAALAKDTHKFESRYLDRLVGPWPEAEAVYAARSPLGHLDGLDRPLIVFQGLDDPVVPPVQSELLVEALARNGVPHAYLAFEGEQHGFRHAESIVRSLRAELAFYLRVLGIPAADGEDEPVPIAFADGLPVTR